MATVSAKGGPPALAAACRSVVTLPDPPNATAETTTGGAQVAVGPILARRPSAAAKAGFAPRPAKISRASESGGAACGDL
jgi:hypothetical protein